MTAFSIPTFSRFTLQGHLNIKFIDLIHTWKQEKQIDSLPSFDFY